MGLMAEIIAEKSARRGLALIAAAWMLLALPAVAAVLGAEDARHLLNRTSFAADAADVQAFARLTREAAVDRLLGWTSLPMRTPPPAWTREPYSPPPVFKQMTDEERQAYRRKQIEQGRDLRAWWVSEMLTTGSPLTEKMVLFWHNHFTSSLRKVRLPLLMYRQHMTLRQHALGHFGEMLHAMARDPAMLIYLDGTGSGKGKPNENFARELMELFTLGEGRYTEQDVKAAARAFTGWGVSRRSGGFVVRPALHDDGIKTFLGVTGTHDGAAVLDILLGRPDTAEWIVSKLWREFVSPEPDAAEVKRIAARFRASRYDIRVALRALLTADAFYAPQARATLIKSPADLIVGTLRLFRVGVDDALPYALTMGYLGQDLFTPPNVKGWPGGEAWINSTTLLGRKRFLEQVFRQSMSGEPAKAAMMAMPDPGDVKARARRAVAALRFDGPGWLAQTRGAGTDWRVLVFPVPPVTPVTGDDVMALRQAVLDPVFQLK